jgi:hypothetical protein
MPSGGPRPNSGRKKGSLTRKTREIAERAAETGMTPLEVMLGVMKELWDIGSTEAKVQAAKIAKDAAPYIHPSLTSVKHSGGLSVRRASEMTDDELAAIASGSRPNVTDAPETPAVTH